MSAQDGKHFFGQLLHGLLQNLQPLQQAEEQLLHSSPLQEPAKDLLAATCQLLGPPHYLQQVLQSVTGLEDQMSSVEPRQLEARHSTVTLHAYLSIGIRRHACTCCMLQLACQLSEPLPGCHVLLEPASYKVVCGICFFI